MCPHKRAFVLDHGIVGDDMNGNIYVSCASFIPSAEVRQRLIVHIGPLHKRNFRLTDGECLNDVEYSVIPFDVKQEEDDLFVLLPEAEELDAVIGTNKWMVKQATVEVETRGGGKGIEIATVEGSPIMTDGCSGAGISCGDSALEW